MALQKVGYWRNSIQNLLTKYGKPVQLSLFEPMYEYPSDNELEKKFAHFLDGEKALQWQGYLVLGFLSILSEKSRFGDRSDSGKS